MDYKPRYTLCVLFTILSLYNVCESVTLMSIDLGSEWMKIAIVSPGVPMEIALNEESKRKTPAAISFRDGHRFFGEDALTAGIRSPQDNYFYLLHIIGHKVDNPNTKLFLSRFPYYRIEPHPERQTIVFKINENTNFTVEELIAQLLTHAKELAESYTNQPIKDAVITIPPFFNQAQRRSLLMAAELSGLKVLTLMNSNTAVALNYGMFRRKEINDTAQYILFYDMGASSTTATIVSYQLIKTKEKGYSETNPHLAVLGLGYDESLGGLEMQLRLRDYLAKKFNEMKKTQNDVFKSPRAMAKIFKEAGRLKKVLSANTEHMSQIEGVLDDQDFRYLVTRKDFEDLCSDLYERIRNPIDQALVSAGMDMSALSQFIVVGGATRIPKVQSILSEIWGQELGKNINADEAAALGAVYRAADLGQGFKVKKFPIKESVFFPIEVDFQRNIENEDGTSLTKTVKRSLFALGNLYPQKKVMTFNKHTGDFGFSVNYGELDHLNKNQIRSFGSRNISIVAVDGVTTAFEKHLKGDSESKGIKAHFILDDSGILSLNSVEIVFEKNITEVVPVEESTLSKIGSTISQFFSGSEKEETNDTKEETNDEAPGLKVNEKEEESKPGKEKDQNETKEVEKKIKLVTVKEILNYTVDYQDLYELSLVHKKEAYSKLEHMNKLEKERKDKEAARNNLESYVLDIQDKMTHEFYEQSSLQDERENIKALCVLIGDWIYEEGFDQPASVYKEKQKELSALFEPIHSRVYEHEHRSEAIIALEEMINVTSLFLNRAQENKEEWFTDTELTTLDKLILDTQKWLEEKEEEQSNIPMHSSPVYTLKDIGEKISNLDRELKYLVNKAKLARALKEQAEADAKFKAEKEAKKNASKINETLDESLNLEPQVNDTEATDLNETLQNGKDEAENKEGDSEVIDEVREEVTASESPKEDNNLELEEKGSEQSGNTKEAHAEL